MFEPAECPQSLDWDGADPETAEHYRSHLRTCPVWAAETDGLQRLSALLIENDPSEELPRFRTERLKQDLLARCAAATEAASPPRIASRSTGNRLKRPVFLFAAALVGALAAAVIMLHPLERLTSGTAVTGELSRPRSAPPANGSHLGSKTPSRNPVEQTKPAKVEPLRTAAQPERLQQMPRPEPSSGVPRRYDGPLISDWPQAPETKQAMAAPPLPKERLVLEIGHRDVPAEFTSVSLVASGSVVGEAGVGVVYTHSEEKAP